MIRRRVHFSGASCLISKILPYNDIASMIRLQSLTCRPAVQSILLRLSVRRHSHHLVKAVTEPSSKPKIFLSRSLDPYLNLSIEHYLLQKTHPESTILFLYTNKPCIIIGRNQNPWLEANLNLLRTTRQPSPTGDKEVLDLVRRRSGGGAVFHDRGNVNYSVICPTAAFDRDRHAEMVVRALKNWGVTQARVNQRHDILLQRSEGLQPLKVSGSAYKVTRLRSLHHGTCLLSSPNIGNISQYLRSPAKPYIKARGVDSVSSPVANVGISNENFEDAVVEEFQQMYASAGEPTIVGVDEELVPEIEAGLAELGSKEWTYLQTPQFTFSTRKTADDDRERPLLPDGLPSGVSRPGPYMLVDVLTHTVLSQVYSQTWDDH